MPGHTATAVPVTPEAADGPGWLGGLCRVDEVYESLPVQGRGSDALEQEVDRPRRLASVVSAYHRRADPRTPLVFGWLRTSAGGPVRVIATDLRPGGRGNADPDRSDVLSFPPGARGVTLPADRAAEMLAAVPVWTRLHGRADGLLLDEAARVSAAELAPGLADALLGVWQGPFGWLLIAEPVPPVDVSAEAGRIAALERDARTRTSPEYVVRADRLDRRHRELRAAESTGLWRVHLLAGGLSPAEAYAVAGLLCAATDLSRLAYALAPAGDAASLDVVLDGGHRAPARLGPAASNRTAADGRDVGESPFLAGSPLVAALIRTPTVEIPGVRVVPRPAFDVTPEVGADPTSVPLGAVIDRDGRPAGPLRLPTGSLNRHTFVCGATGGGKSQTVRHLLEQATAAGLPWLVIEPAKAEYRRMAARIAGGDVVVLRPGDPAAPPVGFNPLAPAPGFPLQTHADLTRALFIAAFQAEEPFPQVLAAAMARCYERLGWDLTLGEPVHPGVSPKLPDLADLQTAAQEVVEEIGYGQEITDNVRGFIGVRLASLRLGTTGRFFEGGHRLDFDRLLANNVVIEIEDVGDDLDKAFLMGAVLIQLVEHLRLRDRSGATGSGLRHLTVIEEAHRLLRRPDASGPAAHAVEMFAALLAEVRAYGEGLVIAEQIPAKLIPDVIKNTAVKVVHRLPAQDDRETVGATMNLTEEQSRYLVTLPPGTGAVFTDGMDRPILARIPDGSGRETASVGGDPVSPARLVATPATVCPPQCGTHPCTLRRMTDARRVVRGDSALVLWAELTVVAHLVGMPAPLPHAGLARRLSELDARLRDCVVRHAVEAAVDSRATALAGSHSPAEFAGHVAEELRGQLGPDGVPAAGAGCPAPPERWLAPCFRWNPVRLALQDRCAHQPDAGRHPDSERWAARYGRAVTGSTCREQLDTVRGWCRELLVDRAAVAAVLFGAVRPTTASNRVAVSRAPARGGVGAVGPGLSALESAVGCARSDPGWRPALDRALRELTVVRRWPLAFLAPTARSGRTGVPPAGHGSAGGAVGRPS